MTTPKTNAEEHKAAEEHRLAEEHQRAEEHKRAEAARARGEVVPVAPSDVSAQTGGPPLDAEAKKAEADAAAMRIVAKAAPDLPLELYLWTKRKLFHEKGMDHVWDVIAKGIGADQPPEGWIDEDNPGLAPPPEMGMLQHKGEHKPEAHPQHAQPITNP